MTMNTNEFWLIDTRSALSWRGRLFVKLALLYERRMSLITAMAFSVCALILCAAVLIPGAIPWAWLPAGLALLVGLAGLCYPIRRAAFWLLRRLV